MFSWAKAVPIAARLVLVVLLVSPCSVEDIFNTAERSSEVMAPAATPLGTEGRTLTFRPLMVLDK